MTDSPISFSVAAQSLQDNDRDELRPNPKSWLKRVKSAQMSLWKRPSSRSSRRRRARSSRPSIRPRRSGSSTANCPGWRSTDACWKRPRTRGTRCLSGYGSCRSRPRTSTNSIWPASQGLCGHGQGECVASPSGRRSVSRRNSWRAHRGRCGLKFDLRPAGRLENVARGVARGGHRSGITPDELTTVEREMAQASDSAIKFSRC